MAITRSPNSKRQKQKTHWVCQLKRQYYVIFHHSGLQILKCAAVGDAGKWSLSFGMAIL